MYNNASRYDDDLMQNGTHPLSGASAVFFISQIYFFISRIFLRS